MWHLLANDEASPVQERLLDYVVLDALKFAANSFTVSDLLTYNQDRMKELSGYEARRWFSEWTILITRRITAAVVWIDEIFPIKMRDRLSDSASTISIQKAARSLLAELEINLRLHLKLLVPASMELGPARCINRFQLIFFELARYKLLRVQHRNLAASNFLMPLSP